MCALPPRRRLYGSARLVLLRVARRVLVRVARSTRATMSAITFPEPAACGFIRNSARGTHGGSTSFIGAIKTAASTVDDSTNTVPSVTRTCVGLAVGGCLAGHLGRHQSGSSRRNLSVPRAQCAAPTHDGSV